MDISRLEKQADGIPVAFVCWWDASTFTVLCPYCGRIESHLPSRTQRDVAALCQDYNALYEVIFNEKALRQEVIAYEINREKKRLEVAGMSIRKSENLLPVVSDKHKLRLDEEKLDQDVVRATKVNGEIPETRIGAVHSFLAPKGQQGDKQAEKGRSHLQKRQLQSKTTTYPIAEVVVEKWFSTKLETRLHGSYFSSVIDLGSLFSLQSSRPTENRIEIYAPLGTKDGSPFSGPFATIKGQQTPQRTVGILHRKGSYPPVIAVSGSRNWMTGSEYVLDNVKWTLEVQRLACYVIHALQRNGLDKDRPEGDIDASHVEKKLIAYFVQRHCFYEDGYEEDVDVLQLKNVLPGQGPQEISIALDNIPCNNCVTFKKKVEACFGVQIHFVEMDYDFRRHTPKKPVSNSMLTPPPSKSQQFAVQIPVQSMEEDDNEVTDEMDEFGDPASPSYRRNYYRSMQNKFLSPSKERSDSSQNTLIQGRKRALSLSVDETEQEVSYVTKKTKSLSISKRSRAGLSRRRIILDSDDETEVLTSVERTRDERFQDLTIGDDRSSSSITLDHEIIVISSGDEKRNVKSLPFGSKDLNEVLQKLDDCLSIGANLGLDTDVTMTDDDMQSNLHSRETSPVVSERGGVEDGSQGQTIASGSKTQIMDLINDDKPLSIAKKSQRRIHSFFGPTNPFDDVFDKDYIDEDWDGDESSNGSSDGDGDDSDGEGQSQGGCDGEEIARCPEFADQV